MIARSSMRTAVGHDGVRIAYHHIAGSDGVPTFVFAHATGFCGAVWAPVVDLVAEQGPGAGVVVVDQRSHGGSATSQHPFDWWDIGRDLRAVLAAEGVAGPIVGVGHSGGGAGVALAEIEAPGTFDALVLVEPILPPPPFVRNPDLALARAAQRRRSWFSSRDEARDRWSQRPPFDSWHPAALDGYLAHGLVPGDDPRTRRTGVVLACDPEDEAEWFWTGDEHGGWDRLGELRPRTVVIAGSRSATHAGGYAEAMTARMPDANLLMVEGADHFVPMTHPRTVVDVALSSTR